MTTASRPARTLSLARLATGILQPATWILAVTDITVWRTAGLPGVGRSLTGTLFAAVIPVAFIRADTRRGTISGPHVSDRRHRLRMVMPFIICSVAAGITLLAVLGAPHLMIAVVAAMLVTLAGLLTVTAKWKISVHSAVSCGATAMLALACGSPLLAAAPLAALT